MKYFSLHILFLSFSLLLSNNLFAQNEVLREQDSLYGISEFGVVVNIEKPAGAEDLSFSVDSVRSLMVNELDGLPVDVLEYETLQQSDQLPILYLHINIMESPGGLYSFSAQMLFYQPAKLPLNNDIQTMASTWHDSFIGVVTPDLTDYIASRSARLAGNFRIDYQSVN
ncbi:MAG: hypothetical protein WD053_11640 [Gracilimonas sp.]